jgi:hypothetical protein
MIRKMLVIAAAIAMPVSVVGVAVAGGTASAVVTPPNGPVTCSVTATVDFAAPGLSTPGSVSTSKTSDTTTNAETFGGGCTGSAPNETIVSKSIKCTGAGTPSSNTACPGKKPTMYGYGSWQNFENSGVSSIQKALKTLTFTINGITYTSKTTSAATLVGSPCVDGSNTQAGFQIKGTVSAPKNDKGELVTLNACLGATTGTGITSTTNFVDNAFGPGTVTSSTLDPADSTIAIKAA